jgi:hypothetical protein
LRFRNITLERCLRGFTAGAHDGVEQLRGVVFEHITQRDCPAPILEGDVTARHVRLCTEDPRPYACQIRGGSVTLEDWTVEYAPTAAQIDVIPSPNDRVEHGHHRITDVDVVPRTPSSAYRARDRDAPIDPEAGISSADASQTVGLRVAESAAVDDWLVERYRSEASLDEAVRFEDGAVVGGEHTVPARFRECVFPADAPLTVSGGTGDVLVDGGRCSGEVEGEGTVEFERCLLNRS